MNLKAHREAAVGQQLRSSVVFANTNRLQHLDRAPYRILLHNPGAFEQKQEWRGTPVHNRHFGTVELDDRVVDLCPSESRHQMFDCPDSDPLAVPQHRAEGRLDRVGPVGWDLDPRISAPEYNSRVRGGRTQPHRDLLARMKPDPPAPDYGFQRPLKRRRCIPHHSTDFSEVVPKPARRYPRANFLSNHSLLRIVARY